MSDKEQPRQNRLAEETSPYLLQHATNPVDWYPWGEEAFEKAEREHKLVLLSVGYSSCHWCHVMEHESFSDPEIADLMNEHFVSIKVDREERPDIDEIYMAATMALNSGQGGWPMTVFLTPDREPVFAGTYFPPQDMHGRPGFPRVLKRLAELWQHDPDGLKQNASRVVQHLRARSESPGFQSITREDLELGVSQFAAEFDAERGGFGTAPKFPPSTGIRFLLRMEHRLGDAFATTMATATLDAMARGGIFDHIGGGFARYSTDADWLVPHFEKMLYDNALLVVAYLEGLQVTGDHTYARVVHDVLGWVEREMIGDEGAFYSSQDADSEGVEGKYYVWDVEEVREALGEQADLFCMAYDISRQGNWEGKNIPHRAAPLGPIAESANISESELISLLDRQTDLLLEVRQTRTPPLTDDKILTSWNGLMVSAFAVASWVLDEPRYLERARSAADFLLTHMFDGKSLSRSARGGKVKHAGQLEDYSYLAEGLIDLYEAGGGPRYLEQAIALSELMRKNFQDDDGSFYSAPASEDLIVRYRDGADGAVPAANAVAASVLARLGRHLNDPDSGNAAAAAITAFGRHISQIPRAYARSLMAMDFLLGPVVEIALIGDAQSRSVLEAPLRQTFLPSRIVTRAEAGTDSFPLASGKLDRGSAAAYVCRDFTCANPTTDPEAFRELLAQAAAGTADNSLRPILGGRASSPATASGSHRTPLGKTGLHVSPFGFGGYRTGLADPDHGNALEEALKNGINLVDTSSNYMDGESERLIGERLQELCEAGEVSREEVVVVTKAGYMQGKAQRRAMDREARHVAYPGVVKFDDSLWHCLHPDFLADEMALSLERLGLETIDVFLLHNPEYFLAHAREEGTTPKEAWSEMQVRLTGAFEFLEKKVSDGSIGCYGVSSNTLCIEPDRFDDLPLGMVLDAATQAGGTTHHMGVVEFPLNLIESRVVTTGLLDRASAEGLGVLTNRPLNAVDEGQIVRLADLRIPVEAINIDKQLERVAELEKDYGQLFAPGVRGTLGTEHPAGQLQFATQLESLIPQIGGLEYWSQIEPRIRHSIDGVLTTADRLLRPSTGPRWTEWLGAYQKEVEDLLTEMRRQAASTSRARATRIREALRPFLPEDREDESLSRLALWTIRSLPQISSVLTGMRRIPYVRDAATVMEWPSLPDPAAALRALAEMHRRD